MLMNNIVYDKDGVRARLMRYDRAATLKQQVIIKTLRDQYPESRYDGTDAMDIDLRDTRNGTIKEFAGVMAGVAELSGLPYPLPDPRDEIALKIAYEHFLTDEGTALYADWATKLNNLLQPFTDEEERSVAALTKEQLADPLLDAPVPSLHGA